MGRGYSKLRRIVLRMRPALLLMAAAILTWCVPSPMAQERAPRARDLGIQFQGANPGPLNAITDVGGVEVGMTTLISGEGQLVEGKGPIRTGVTAILPRGRTFDPVFAAHHVLNGNGDMTGTHWVEESGFLETPILITNTGSVGVVRDAALGWMNRHKYFSPLVGHVWF